MNQFIIFIFYLLFEAFLFPSQAFSSPPEIRFYLDPNSEKLLSPEEALAFFKRLDQVNQILPEKMKSSIQNPVLIHWAAFDSDSTLKLPICFEPKATQNSTIYGFYHFNPLLSSEITISLNKNFIPLLRSDSNSSIKYPCGHKDTERLHRLPKK